MSKKNRQQYAEPPAEVMDHPEETIMVKDETKHSVTYTEVALDKHGEPIDLKALQKLLDKQEDFPRVVVKCNRSTGEWHLFRNDAPYKKLSAAILINVSFSCEWQKGEENWGCGGRSETGEYIGYAAGDLLPMGKPMTVPKEGVSGLAFDPDDGRFFDPETGAKLSGSGYLILKPDCSSEYVGSQVLGAVKETKKPK